MLPPVATPQPGCWAGGAQRRPTGAVSITGESLAHSQGHTMDGRGVQESPCTHSLLCSLINDSWNTTRVFTCWWHGQCSRLCHRCSLVALSKLLAWWWLRSEPLWSWSGCVSVPHGSTAMLWALCPQQGQPGDAGRSCFQNLPQLCPQHPLPRGGGRDPPDLSCFLQQQFFLFVFFSCGFELFLPLAGDRDTQGPCLATGRRWMLGCTHRRMGSGQGEPMACALLLELSVKISPFVHSNPAPL